MTTQYRQRKHGSALFPAAVMAERRPATSAEARASLWRTLRTVSTNFWSRTSIGGLSHAHSTPWRPFQVIWLGFFIGGIVLTSMDLNDLREEFKSWKHTTQVDVRYELAAKFPAVTVCNQNRIDCLQLVELSLRQVDDSVLQDILVLSRCLETGQSFCLYVWNVMGRIGGPPDTWMEQHSTAACLQCEECPHLRLIINHLAMASGPETAQDARKLQLLYRQIGCGNCTQHSSPAAPGQGQPADSVKFAIK